MRFTNRSASFIQTKPVLILPPTSHLLCDPFSLSHLVLINGCEYCHRHLMLHFNILSRQYRPLFSGQRVLATPTSGYLMFSLNIDSSSRLQRENGTNQKVKFLALLIQELRPTTSTANISPSSLSLKKQKYLNFSSVPQLHPTTIFHFNLSYL